MEYVFVLAISCLASDLPGSAEIVPRKVPRDQEFHDGYVSGTVVALTPDSITLSIPARVVIIERTGPDGVVQEENRVIPARPAKRFTVSAVFARGGYPRDRSQGYRYRLTDVRVGDLVSLESDLVKGTYVVAAISILRRPGGRVPPENEPPPDPRRLPLSFKHHERAQAYQDWEEKGIPLPDKFLSAEELEARKARTAPMPRLVTPRVP